MFGKTGAWQPAVSSDSLHVRLETRMRSSHGYRHLLEGCNSAICHFADLETNGYADWQHDRTRFKFVGGSIFL